MYKILFLVSKEIFLKKFVPYKFFNIRFKSFSFTSLFSFTFEKTIIVSLEILSLPEIFISLIISECELLIINR